VPKSILVPFSGHSAGFIIIAGLVHTGNKIDFDSVDLVEVDRIDHIGDKIDRAVDMSPVCTKPKC